jgi:FkbM family methyltransferase
MVYVPTIIARIMNRIGLLSLVKLGYTLKVLNRTFKIPIIEGNVGLLFHQSVGEPYLLQVFKNLYSKNDFLFLDAGVNFGQTLLKVKAINRKVVYIGFEPSGLCSYYTSRLIKVNNIQDATLIKCALSDSAGVLTLRSETEGDTRATIMETDSPLDNKYQEIVPVITLDSITSIISSYGKDILLKIDVEGAEWMVLQGAEKMIDTHRPVIVFENLPYKGDSNRQASQEAISSFLRDKNFELYLLDESAHSLQKITDINNLEDYSKTNYLAVPAERTNIV